MSETLCSARNNKWEGTWVVDVFNSSSDSARMDMKTLGQMLLCSQLSTSAPELISVWSILINTSLSGRSFKGETWLWSSHEHRDAVSCGWQFINAAPILVSTAAGGAELITTDQSDGDGASYSTRYDQTVSTWNQSRSITSCFQTCDLS